MLRWFKRLSIWRYLGSYFPVILVKSNPDLEYDPSQVYLFGYHPHGIISCGCFCSFACEATGSADLFPGIKIFPATLVANFYVPFFREILLR